ncbi:hypothetical protein IHQ72_26705 [Mesorhizobium onobrychidis]|uniref:Uncharacterized protein n=1 Tax=Mesorhizobium onobrychidis TaxID=2775404 RepID=A0ABY5QU72_9HYPH|nr:hypothetical protein IHQ72_26705 [Mesorhizobium onobrychidis]
MAIEEVERRVDRDVEIDFSSLPKRVLTQNPQYLRSLKLRFCGAGDFGKR